MNGHAKIVTKVLSRSQLAFIESELGFDADAILAMNDDAVLDMYDKICNIEIEETMTSDSRDGEYSNREKMAEGIVTSIGNALYRQDDEE